MAKDKLSFKKDEDFSNWYTDLLVNSEFIDYSAVSGMIIFRSSSYYVWDKIREYTDRLFKASGIKDVYFPLFIPKSLLEKEKEHIAGFSPEVAWVTQGGNTKLDEMLAVRPTSETIMYYNFSKWIKSWRDLPMRLNQWNNVVRWEFKHPTPFLRTREFLWNEGHTVFANEEGANAERDVILNIYMDVLNNLLALPGMPGRKTNKEKFAGALASYSIELLMPDGWAIQGPDFHNDGQNFAKVFDIKYSDKNGDFQYVWQNTFAISSRVIGIMVANHSDDKGLIIPPKLAEVQVVIIPIFNDKTKDKVLDYCYNIRNSLSKFRVLLDDEDSNSPGWKFNEYELKGVPFRLEVGEREVDNGKVTLKTRDLDEKKSLDIDDVPKFLDKEVENMQLRLYKKAEKYLNDHIHQVDSYDEFKDMISKNSGFVLAPWCGSMECEDKIADETKAKATNMPFSKQDLAEGKKCIYCGKDAEHMVNFARSY